MEAWMIWWTVVSNKLANDIIVYERNQAFNYCLIGTYVQTNLWSHQLDLQILRPWEHCSMAEEFLYPWNGSMDYHIMCCYKEWIKKKESGIETAWNNLEMVSFQSFQIRSQLSWHTNFNLVRCSAEKPVEPTWASKLRELCDKISLILSH